jgi:hypothetical protein
MSGTTEVDSVEAHDIARGESILFSAAYGPQLYGATLTSVASVAQTSGTTTLTVGAGSINTAGPIDVDGFSRAVSTVVQFRVTVPAGAVVGSYVVTVSAVTSRGDTRYLRCRLRVV